MWIDWRTPSVFGAAFAAVFWTFESEGAGSAGGAVGGDRYDRRRRLYALMQLRQGGVR